MGTVTVRHEKSKDLDNLLKNMKSGSVKIGWFPSARYDDDKSTPVAQVAAVQEYGYPPKNIPARPFVRPAIENNQTKWKNIGERGLKAILKQKSTAKAVLENIGITAVGDIQHAISQVYSPVLKQRTIEARLARRNAQGGRRLTKTQAQGIAKPLIDTGHMQATVSYEIEGAQ